MAKEAYKVETIFVKFSRKVQPRQFSPVVIELGESTTVTGDAEYVDKVYLQRFKRLKKIVDQQCEKILEEESPDDD